MTLALQTQGFGKSYGKFEALKPIDLEIPLGTCFGLLGPNGAGKSTLVKSLLSIVHPSHGRAELLGHDSKQPSIRKQVGYLPEGHRFPRYLTGHGVCDYFGRLRGLGGSELKTEINEKLALVGMADWGKTKISKYSKGMNQRVGLAQALLGNPQLIFLDEPTDGVDPQGRREIRDVIREAAARGTTIFLNSHLLSEVEALCDRVVILNKGQVIGDGSTQEIVKQFSGATGSRFRWRCGALSPEVRTTLQTRGASFIADGFEITIENDTEITPMIDELRRADVAIYGIESQSGNLEDAFINAITGQAEGESA